MAADPLRTPDRASTSTPGISPQSDEDPPHDILAAEEFAVPAPAPELHHREPVVLPPDPTGIPEPHDILAAEEFPIPSVPARPTLPRSRQTRR